MKFKLDENLGARTQQIFRDAGHEVSTVVDEQLQGTSDEKLFEVICSEHLCLVTLDMGFANVLRFLPEKTSGLIILRVPQNPSLALLESMVKTFLALLAERSKAGFPRDIQGTLWVVEVGRIRVHYSAEQ